MGGIGGRRSGSGRNERRRPLARGQAVPRMTVAIVAYTKTKLLCCTPETNVTLHINFTTIKKVGIMITTALIDMIAKNK